MRLLQCEFDPVSYRDALDWARQHLLNGKPGYITTVNVAILMTMRVNTRLKKFIERSSLTVADGQPIIWLSNLLGRPLPERVTGVDLVPGLCQCAADTNSSVYFLGSEKSVVENVVAEMQKQVPDLEVAGFHDGYFQENETAERVNEIRNSGASLLIVGLGVPKQEAFLEENWQQLGVQLAIPIGGAFDMLTGNKVRAPKWMQRSGLEWLWRIRLEPRRLAGRYLTTNSRFIWLSGCALLAAAFRTLLSLRRQSVDAIPDTVMQKGTSLNPAEQSKH